MGRLSQFAMLEKGSPSLLLAPKLNVAETGMARLLEAQLELPGSVEHVDVWISKLKSR